MNKKLSLFLIGLWACQGQAQEAEKEKKIKPLSEQFLLFLAEMESVEGELIHPVDLALTPPSESNNPKAKQENKDGKQKDDN